MILKLAFCDFSKFKGRTKDASTFTIFIKLYRQCAIPHHHTQLLNFQAKTSRKIGWISFMAFDSFCTIEKLAKLLSLLLGLFEELFCWLWICHY